MRLVTARSAPVVRGPTIATAVPNLRLRLANTPVCVAVVHHALSALSREMQLDALASDGVLTATAEACKNVALHAYDGLDGPLEVEVETLPDALEVTVRDHGIGIRPHLGERRQPHNGIGLPIVHLLTRRVSFSNLPEGGTETRMLFDLPGLAPLPVSAGSAPESSPREAELSSTPETLELVIAPGSLAKALLPSVVPALALAVGAGNRPQLREVGVSLALLVRSLPVVRLATRVEAGVLALSGSPLPADDALFADLEASIARVPGRMSRSAAAGGHSVDLRFAAAAG